MWRGGSILEGGEMAFWDAARRGTLRGGLGALGGARARCVPPGRLFDFASVCLCGGEVAFWDAARRCAAGDTALRVTVGATGWGSGSPHSAWPPFWLPRSDWCLLVPRGGGILGRCAAGWGALLGLGLAAFCLAGSLILLVLACAAGRWHFGTLRRISVSKS